MLIVEDDAGNSYVVTSVQRTVADLPEVWKTEEMLAFLETARHNPDEAMAILTSIIEADNQELDFLRKWHALSELSFFGDKATWQVEPFASVIRKFFADSRHAGPAGVRVVWKEMDGCAKMEEIETLLEDLTEEKLAELESRGHNVRSVRSEIKKCGSLEALIKANKDENLWLDLHSKNSE